jgi:uncharacterized glyoxalase superfamily protein PhnB
MSTPPAGSATVIPTLRYRNAEAAIDWLVRVFGFARKAVYASDDGVVQHAELTFGNGMIMLGSHREDELTRFLTVPGDLGGRSTGCVYVVVENIQTHHDHAVAAGAKIIRPLKAEPYGSTYCCTDLEGYLWSFGDYDPWDSPAAA